METVEPQPDHTDVYSSGGGPAPTIADVLPSALASLGVDGERNTFGSTAVDRVVVLLVDGMGDALLRRNTRDAPFLTERPADRFTVGFPTTTATSIASLGTGLPSGEHGITGYRSYVAEVDGVLGWLGWTIDDADARSRFVPEYAQRRATAFERAAAAGITTTTVLPAQFRTSGLTRAVLRGGRFAGTHAQGDLIAETAAAAGSDDRTLTYCYVSELDTVGHGHGPESDAWHHQLRVVDRLVEQLAQALPRGTRLLVTADHGMIDARRGPRFDLDDDAALGLDVRVIAGEPRCRHVYTDRPDSVVDRWSSVLGEHAWVGTRDTAIGAGLFGPVVTDDARGRIGDVVAVARGNATLARMSSEPLLSGLPGQHGALTDDELYVPLIVAREA